MLENDKKKAIDALVALVGQLEDDWVRAIILGELRDDSRVVPRVRRIRDVSEMVWTHNDMSVK